MGGFRVNYLVVLEVRWVSPSSLPAILRPARRQVNAKGYSGKFMRRRRDWKRGSERSESKNGSR